MKKKPQKQGAGKGDKPRSCFGNNFKTNYEEIDWGEPAQKKKDHKFIKKY
tara:strand:+ start:391 stop:540 length:150 start_codon:yes stop_codon:yes gene_type:complete